MTTTRPTPTRRAGARRRATAMAVSALAALATIGGVACASGGGEVAQTGAGTVVTVDAVDNTFRPEVIEVEPGTEVVWTNRGRSNHDVVPTEGDSWGIALSEFTPGESYSHVFTEPGEYPYYCTVHGTKTRGMIGTVVVKG